MPLESVEGCQTCTTFLNNPSTNQLRGKTIFVCTQITRSRMWLWSFCRQFYERGGSQWSSDECQQRILTQSVKVVVVCGGYEFLSTCKKMQQADKHTAPYHFERLVCSSSRRPGTSPTQQEATRRETAFLKDMFICPLKTGQSVSKVPFTVCKSCWLFDFGGLSHLGSLQRSVQRENKQRFSELIVSVSCCL